MELTPDQRAALHYFLSRVGDGYIELSQDKVRGEYLYFKKVARELLWELFPRREQDDEAREFNDDF